MYISTKGQLEVIASAWDGKEAGIQEDRAHLANAVLKGIKELEESYE